MKNNKHSKLGEKVIHLDCTLRDGGYYNSWDFSVELINKYLQAIDEANIDVVELGLRLTDKSGFKGACAFTTDNFILGLNIPNNLKVGVMVNGADLLSDRGQIEVLESLFPNDSSSSPVDLVRLACHLKDIKNIMPAISWLSEKGFQVGLNIMQISEYGQQEITSVAKLIAKSPVEVLYFADSLGNMSPDDVIRINGWIRDGWNGPMGIHTHDNLGLALSNTMTALTNGINWVDSTVTGMGRGPGNALTEQLAIELGTLSSNEPELNSLLEIIRSEFDPMKKKYGWGTNPYYYLAGKYSIHPSYIQKMMNDSRYSSNDILAVISHLRNLGGTSFNSSIIEEVRMFYTGEPKGKWDPKTKISGREVLLIGTGPNTSKHSQAIENYITRKRPIVIVLNTQTSIKADLIDYRVACHPVRLLADSKLHMTLPQKLITPFSMLPEPVKLKLSNKDILDFGMSVQNHIFSFNEFYCNTPNSLVISYSLAIIASGKASRIIMAGFDGYPSGDKRNNETNDVIKLFKEYSNVPLLAVTNTSYDIDTTSIYNI